MITSPSSLFTPAFCVAVQNNLMLGVLLPSERQLLETTSTDCEGIFVATKPDIFNEMWGLFSMFVVAKTGILTQRVIFAEKTFGDET